MLDAVMAVAIPIVMSNAVVAIQTVAIAITIGDPCKGVLGRVNTRPANPIVTISTIMSIEWAPGTPVPA